MEIPETNDFKGQSIQIKMFEMIENGIPFHIKILLEKQKLAYLNIALSYENVFVNEAEVELRLADEEKDSEIEGVEIQENPPRSGKYTIQVEPNSYILSVRRRQFEDYSQYIDLKSGTNDLAIVLKNVDPMSKTKVISDRAVLKKISVYDVLTKLPIQNA